MKKERYHIRSGIHIYYFVFNLSIIYELTTPSG
jgi:hypothetical protein